MAEERNLTIGKFNPVVPSSQEQEPEQTSKFIEVPTSPATDLMLNVLSAGAEGLEQFAKRRKTLSHNKTKVGIERTILEENGIKREQVTIGQLSKKEKITLVLNDINILIGSNKPAKKLFVFILSEMAHKALSISDGVLYFLSMEFSLQELVDRGLYNDIRTARRGFTTGMDILTSMKIGGDIDKSKKKKNHSDIAVLFPYAEIDNGYCHIDFNQRVDWGIVAQYCTKLPPYIFALDTKAFDLLDYIFYLARQNTKEILEKGYFFISYRAIQGRLSLPDETNTTHPQRDIKDVIDKAINDIGDAHKNWYSNMDFQLLPYIDKKREYNPDIDDKLSTREWLDRMYLKVTLEGEYASFFTDIATGTKAKIEKAEKQKQKIYEQALIRNMAEKMKQEEAKNSTASPEASSSN